MIANYHTHTRWCRHGSGEIEAYILEGIQRGLETLAITEHVPLLGDPDSRRMSCAEFPAFNRELDGMIDKYGGQIQIIKGFECEYFPNQLDSYCRFQEEYGYGLLILGHHNSCDYKLDNFALTEPWQVRLYADEVCEALETGLFTFLAHPDVAFHGYQQYDECFRDAMRQIFSVCAHLDIPVEINANGHHYRRGYPCETVWQTIAPQYKLRCLVGSDAHEVKDLAHASVTACENMARAAGLNLIDRLKLPDVDM